MVPKMPRTVAFFRGSGSPFSEFDEGFGGTQLVSLRLGELLSKRFRVVFVFPGRKETPRGRTGIEYVSTIDESEVDVFIDLRWVRNTFIPGKTYIHWSHDCFRGNRIVVNPDLRKYSYVVTLTNIQCALWKAHTTLTNLRVINNLFVDEGVGRQQLVNRNKIVCFSARTKWDVAIQVVNLLRQRRKDLELHLCSPAYHDISQRFKDVPFVVNHGTVSHRRMMGILSDAFVCLCPTSTQESFGAVFYESMYFGVPMLTEYVDGSGANEIIPKGLIFGEGSSPQSFANMINRFYDKGRPTLGWTPDNDSIVDKWTELITQ
jgi:glycosyltransferase involved in cell wall biosynthesis